jgi:hypothetical protein
VTSADGVNWSSPTFILQGQSYPIQSPSIVQAEGELTMWTVGAGAAGCKSQATRVEQRTSRDGIEWTAPQVVNISVPGQIIWHLNVIESPATGRFLGMITAFPEGSSCSWSSLYFADSIGQRWETFTPALVSPSGGWDSQEIYRASPLYDAAKSLLRVWYSARTQGTNTWRIGYTEGAFPLRW